MKCTVQARRTSLRNEMDRAGLVFQLGVRTISDRRSLFFCDAGLAFLIPLLQERMRRRAEEFHTCVITS